jgi:hypothetical protein
VEVSVFVLGVLFERMRPDLAVRRWWSRLGLRPVVGVRLPVAIALAGVEARRLAVRASTLLVLYVLYKVWFPNYPSKAYDGVNGQVGFALGFVGVAVMALVASVGGRDRGVEIVQAVPSGARSRVRSWFVLFGMLGALEYLALLVNRAVREAPSYAALLPDAWELAQGPLMVVGAGLLGLLAARLLPPWIAAPVCVVGSVAWVGVFSNNVPNGTMLAPVIEWVQYHDDASLVTIEPGSFAWHNAYLLGLCLLGVVAVLTVESARRRALLVAGGALVAATAVCGALAIP